jgi:hypothetical protein
MGWEDKEEYIEIVQDKEEDVKSYWMSLRKREHTGK